METETLRWRVGEYESTHDRLHRLIVTSLQGLDIRAISTRHGSEHADVCQGPQLLWGNERARLPRRHFRYFRFRSRSQLRMCRTLKNVSQVIRDGVGVSGAICEASWEICIPSTPLLVITGSLITFCTHLLSMHPPSTAVTRSLVVFGDQLANDHKGSVSR